MPKILILHVEGYDSRITDKLPAGSHYIVTDQPEEALAKIKAWAETLGPCADALPRDPHPASSHIYGEIHEIEEIDLSKF